MISILHLDSDEVVKTFRHAKFMTNPDLLNAYLAMLQKTSYTKILQYERKLVLLIRQELGALLGANPSGSVAEIEAFTLALQDSVLLQELMPKLLIYSYWRDDCNYADFVAFPNTLEPFHWIMPLLTIDYALDITAIKGCRVDWSAFYYIKHLREGK